MPHNAIVVLGGGVDDDGKLNPQGESRVVKAVELLKKGEAPIIIFSGKWSHKRKILPRLTEATALAKRAIELGVKENHILLEEESMMTGTNICNVKTLYLIPRGWKRIIVVTSPLHANRTKINLQNILGPSYSFKIVPSDFHLTPDEAEIIKKSEREKIKKSADFFSDIAPGDHEAAYDKALTWSKQGL